MIKKSTIQRGILGIGIILTLTLTGVFNTFAREMVIPGHLSLNTVIIIAMVGMLGYGVAYPLRRQKPLVIMGNAILATLALAVVWIVAVWFTTTVDTRFVLQNLTGLNPSPLTFGEIVRFVPTETGCVQLGGLLTLVVFCAMMGAISGGAVLLPLRIQQIFGISIALTIVLSLLSNQINRIISFPDVMGLVIPFGVAYGVSWLLHRQSRGNISQIMLFAIGFGIGVVVALALLAIGDEAAFSREGILRGLGSAPQIIDMGIRGLWWLLIIVLGLAGVGGALAPRTEHLVHNMSLYFVTLIIILGLLNMGGRNLPLHIPVVIFVLLVITISLAPPLGNVAERQFDQLKQRDRWRGRVAFLVILAGVVLVAPQYMGVSLANNVNLIILYATLGIGLNVMIGFAGLLDLGFVASIAIGAYTIGILTGPNILTCDGVAINPNLITLEEINALCTGRIDFWGALPIAVVVSAVTGMLLGVPVLGLRGDYLAIVTLGFGEIVGRIIYSDRFKPLVGGAQGLSPIYPPKIFFPQWETPLPVPSMFSAVNGSGITILFGNAVSMFYLYVIAFLLSIFITHRLSVSRQGRSWRALRADEDVAQAMGIHKVRTKLMAFGVSSAIGGLGGAILAAQLQSVTPENYKLAFSINVLALVIIGGMGSIPGVILGAAVLAGLPELLRQLEGYRLLAFGGLLVLVMLVRPEGLLPPRPPKLSEQARSLLHPQPTGTD